MTPGLRGFYEGSDGTVFRRLPRNVDPKQDGTHLAQHRPRLFNTTDPDDSVPLAEFDRRIEALVPAAVIARIDNAIEAGAMLSTRGLADQPPLALHEWRRGMILSWSHARDLEVIHDAMGHPRALANRHDVDEVVLAIHLKKRIDRADPWYRNYVQSLDDGAWINVGFFNPHLSASMYKWGDAKHGMQNAMDAHRLSAHHQGNPEAPLDWIERAVNFVIHHIPREHWGIRHEPRGSYHDLEPRLAEDPAIKNSEIGKAIARDAAALCALLEQEGKIVPWGKLAVPKDQLTPSVIEHAFLITRPTGNARPEMLTDGETGDEEPARIQRAHTILARLPEAIAEAEAVGRPELVAAYRKFLADV
ncbi:MAG: hypothetical protein H8K08_03155 [Nitrospira sp.]|nr:hypothetical protein [Nitrospira sp.]